MIYYIYGPNPCQAIFSSPGHLCPPIVLRFYCTLGLLNFCIKFPSKRSIWSPWNRTLRTTGRSRSARDSLSTRFKAGAHSPTNRKLPSIVGPKSDMADYRRLPPIIIFPRCKFSHCPIFHPIFLPILRSVGQWNAGFRVYSYSVDASVSIWRRKTRRAGFETHV